MAKYGLAISLGLVRLWFKDKIRVRVRDRVSNKVSIGIRVSAFYTGSLQKPALSNRPAFYP